MAVAAGAVALISFYGRYAGQRILLTLPYRCQTAPAGEKTTPEVTAALGAAMNSGGATGLKTRYLNLMSSGYNLNFIRSQLVYPSRFRAFDTIVNEAGAVTSVGPPNVAAVMSNFTIKSGRDQVSNKHIGPFPTGLQANGTLTAGALADMGLLQTSVLAPLNLSGTGFGVWVPTIYHTNPKPGGLPADDLVGGTVFDTVRVMRRRTVGFGE